MIRLRYYSHIGLPTGYGRAATELALALDAHPEVDLELVQIPTTGNAAWSGLPETDLRIGHLAQRLRHTNTGLGVTGSDADVVLVHTLPGDCARLLEREGLLDHPRCVAYTTYEGAAIPRQLMEALRPFQRVWFPTRLFRTPMGTGMGMPASNLPHAFDPSMSFPPRMTPAGERFRFYWIGAWTQRKNPAGLIRAFCRAFAPTDDVELLLRTNVDRGTYLQAMAATGLEPRDLPMITLIAERLTDHQIWELHANADCYVTASRGEAWDLGAFEAYLSKRMIISPTTGAYDYLRYSNYKVVGTVMAPAHVDAQVIGDPEARVAISVKITGAQGLSCRDIWMEPDHLHLAERMREVYTARERDLVHTIDPASKFSHKVVAELAVDDLKEILRS